MDDIFSQIAAIDPYQQQPKKVTDMNQFISPTLSAIPAYQPPPPKTRGVIPQPEESAIDRELNKEIAKIDPYQQKPKKSDSYWGAGKESLKGAPEQFSSSFAQATLDLDAASAVNPDVRVKAAREQQKKIQEQFESEGVWSPGQTTGPYMQNLAFSGTAMTGGAAGAAAGFAAGSVIPVIGQTVGATTGALVGASIPAFRASRFQFMQDLLEKRNQDKIARTGQALTDDEEKKIRDENYWEATKYGLWEAIPEAVGSLMEAKAFLSPIIGALKKEAGIAASKMVPAFIKSLGWEVGTEAATQTGQHNIELRAGMGEPGEKERSLLSPVDWMKSAWEVAPQTLLLTGTMGIGAKGAQMGARAWNSYDGGKKSKLVTDMVKEQKYQELPDQDFFQVLNHVETLAKSRPDDVDLQAGLRLLQFDAHQRIQQAAEGKPRSPENTLSPIGLTMERESQMEEALGSLAEGVLPSALEMPSIEQNREDLKLDRMEDEAGTAKGRPVYDSAGAVEGETPAGLGVSQTEAAGGAPLEEMFSNYQSAKEREEKEAALAQGIAENMEASLGSLTSGVIPRAQNINMKRFEATREKALSELEQRRTTEASNAAFTGGQEESVGDHALSYLEATNKPAGEALAANLGYRIGTREIPGIIPQMAQLTRQMARQRVEPVQETLSGRGTTENQRFETKAEADIYIRDNGLTGMYMSNGRRGGEWYLVRKPGPAVAQQEKGATPVPEKPATMDRTPSSVGMAEAQIKMGAVVPERTFAMLAKGFGGKQIVQHNGSPHVVVGGHGDAVRLMPVVPKELYKGQTNRSAQLSQGTEINIGGQDYVATGNPVNIVSGKVFDNHPELVRRYPGQAERVGINIKARKYNAPKVKGPVVGMLTTDGKFEGYSETESTASGNRHPVKDQDAYQRESTLRFVNQNGNIVISGAAASDLNSGRSQIEKLARTLIDKGVDPNTSVIPAGKDYSIGTLHYLKNATLRRFAISRNTGGLSARDVALLIEPYANAWKHVKIYVVQSISELPAGLRQQATAQEARVPAVYYEGEEVGGRAIFMIADQIATPYEAQKYLLHEAAAHLGLRRMFGSKFDSFLRTAAKAIPQSELQRVAQAYSNQEQTLDLFNDQDLLLVAEEYLAEVAESNQNPGLIRRAIAAIKTWLNEHGIEVALSDMDLKAIVASSKGNLAKAPAWQADVPAGVQSPGPPRFAKATDGELENPLRSTVDELDVEGRIRRRENRKEGIGAPRNERTVFGSGNNVFVTGHISPQDWADRVNRLMPPRDLTDARYWYKQLHESLAPIVGEDASRWGLAWLLSQKNASASGGFLNVLRASDKLAGKKKLFTAGLNEKALLAALSGKVPEGGIGAKLMDFIDSELGRTWRTYYLDRPEGKHPAAIDIWAMRDMGVVDNTVINWVRKAYGDEAAARLSVDFNATEAQYEYGIDFYNEISDLLNKGKISVGQWAPEETSGGKWTPREIQAIGWVAMQKQMGIKAEFVRDIISKNTRRVSIGLAPAGGTRMDNVLAGREIPAEVAQKEVEYLAKLANVRVLDTINGAGAWLTNLEGAIQVYGLASPEATRDFMDMVGYAFQQSMIIGSRAKVSGNRTAVNILTPAFADHNNAMKFFVEFLNHVPKGKKGSLLVEGFSQVKVDGIPGIQFLNLSGKWNESKIGQIFEAVNAASELTGIEIHGNVIHNTEIVSSENDWRNDRDGKAYLSSLRDRGRLQEARLLERRYVPSRFDLAGDGTVLWGGKTPREPGRTGEGPGGAGRVGKSRFALAARSEAERGHGTGVLVREGQEEVAGAAVSAPARTYSEASKTGTNPWVRQSDSPTNQDRVLMVQISSSLLNKAMPGDEASAYYDKLYSGARQGYERLEDFWEIPQWMGYLSHFIPNADVYVVRDMAEAKEFLSSAGYGQLVFSTMDVNASYINELLGDYGGQAILGGYANRDAFAGLQNATWHDSPQSMAQALGMPYTEGVDYRHFEGTGAVPRLTMSQGCLHKCAFCTVEKQLTTTPRAVVRQQAEAIAKLGSRLIYLNDKTFGQAPNYKDLAEIYQLVKEINPEFYGFIVQTTAAQMKRISPEWLAKSGIKYIELGVESFNDELLRKMHKPANEAIIEEATQKIREAGMKLIPNILIGYPGETAETYAKTLGFFDRNADVISHANIYNLAVYDNTELAETVGAQTEEDKNENVLEKSFHKGEEELHRGFAEKMYSRPFFKARFALAPNEKKDLATATKNAEKIGFTDNYLHSGFIMPDGRMLDMYSGTAERDEDYSPGMSSRGEHDEYAKKLLGVTGGWIDVGRDALLRVQKAGIVRYHADPGATFIEIGQPMNEKQISGLSKHANKRRYYLVEQADVQAKNRGGVLAEGHASGPRAARGLLEEGSYELARRMGITRFALAPSYNELKTMSPDQRQAAATEVSNGDMRYEPKGTWKLPDGSEWYSFSILTPGEETTIVLTPKSGISLQEAYERKKEEYRVARERVRFAKAMDPAFDEKDPMALAAAEVGAVYMAPTYRDRAVAAFKTALEISDPDNMRAKRLYSNPWYLAKENEHIRQILKFQMERDENRHQLFADMTQSTTGEKTEKGRPMMHEILNLDDKEAEALGKLIYESTVQNSKMTEEQLRARGMNGAQIAAYEAWDKRMKEALKLRYDSLEKMLMLPYTSEVWYNDLSTYRDKVGFARGGARTSAINQLIQEVSQKYGEDQGIAFGAAIETLHGPMNDLRKLYEEMGQRKFYAPLMHGDGKYVVRVRVPDAEAKDGQRVVWSYRVNSKIQAAKTVDMLKNAPEYKDYRHASITTEIEKGTPESVYQSVDLDSVYRFIEKAVENVKRGQKFTPEETAAIRQEVMRAAAEELKARGWGRYAIQRRHPEIGGYEMTPIKVAFINYMSGLSGLVTKQEAAAKMSDVLWSVPLKNSETFEYCARYVKDLMRNTTDLDRTSGKIRAAAFLYYLAGVPRLALVQLTQNLVMGIPKLAGVTGSMSKGHVEYMRAMKDIATGNMTEEEKDLVERAVTRGAMAPQYMDEVFNEARSTVGAWSQKTIDVLSFAFRGMEHYNRKSAFLAAIRCGLDYDKAVEFVNDVHIMYGKANLPEWQRGGESMHSIARTAMTFKQYPHNYMLYMKQALTDKQYNTFALSLAYTFALGGMAGLPWADDIMALLEKFTGKPLRKQVKASMAKASPLLADVGAAGLPALLNVDISGSVKVGAPVPIQFITNPRGSLQQDIFGVYTGLTDKAIRVVESAERGQYYRMVEAAMPAMIENPMKGYREATEGVRTRKERPLLTNEGRPFLSTAYEGGLRAIGLSPERVKAAQFDKEEFQRVQTHWAGVREDIHIMFRAAKTQEDRNEALRRAMEYNGQVRQFGGSIPLLTSDSLRGSLKFKDKNFMRFERQFASE